MPAGSRQLLTGPVACCRGKGTGILKLLGGCMRFTLMPGVAALRRDGRLGNGGGKRDVK